MQLHPRRHGLQPLPEHLRRDTGVATADARVLSVSHAGMVRRADYPSSVQELRADSSTSPSVCQSAVSSIGALSWVDAPASWITARQKSSDRGGAGAAAATAYGLAADALLRARDHEGVDGVPDQEPPGTTGCPGRWVRTSRYWLGALCASAATAVTLRNLHSRKRPPWGSVRRWQNTLEAGLVLYLV
jgi:hypothetical protein